MSADRSLTVAALFRAPSRNRLRLARPGEFNMRWPWRKDKEADLKRELHSDLELQIEEEREKGLSPSDARYAAQRAFGNLTSIQEEVREVWGWMAVERFRQDLRYGMRT